MNYNLTSAENATNILEVFTGVNDASGGLIGSFTLIGVFLIMLFSMLRQNPVPESFTAASTVTVVVALILIYVEVVSVVWLIGLSIMWALSAIALYRSNSS